MLDVEKELSLEADQQSGQFLLQDIVRIGSAPQDVIGNR